MSKAVATRCRNCGSSGENRCYKCKEARVQVLSTTARRKCGHRWITVYGVPSWRRLCIKCGGMTR